MALSDYALVSLPEAKAYLHLQGTEKNSELEDIINRATDEIEAHLERQIISRGALTEFHTFQTPDARQLYTPDLLTLERPIISVTTVHEDTDWPRTYGASFLLTANTEYQIVKPRGLIRRLDTGFGPTAWDTGHRAVQVVYTAGYADVTAVPARIKGVALRYIGALWSEQSRDDHNVSSQSDALGNFTRFYAAQLTPDMKRALGAEERTLFHSTGERAA